MPPHFHATYGEKEVIVSIHDLEVLEGSMPNKQKLTCARIAAMWTAYRQKEPSMSENCAAMIDSLIAYRHSRNMTQKDLAQAARLTQSVIARLERKKATPQLDTLVKVTAALDCDLKVVPTAK